MGESGFGKSILLNLIVGLDSVDLGEIWFFGFFMYYIFEYYCMVFCCDNIG